MKSMRIFAVILLLLLFASCNCQSIYEANLEAYENCVSCKPKAKIKSPNHSYVNTDLEVFHHMVNPIIHLKPTILAYKKVYPELRISQGNTRSRTIELLDDLKITFHKFYGGYTDFNLTILSYNDAILYSRLQIEVNDHVFEKIYLKEIKIPLTCSGRKMEYFKMYKKNIQAYQQKHPYFTLEIDNFNHSPTVLTAYYNMNQAEDNYERFQVTEEYASFSNYHAQYLLENKEYQVLEKLLYGVNPVGRIYAYTALKIASIKDYKPTPRIKKQMEEVQKKGLKFIRGQKTSHQHATAMDFSRKITF